MPRWNYKIELSDNIPLFDKILSFDGKTGIDNVYSSKNEAEKNLDNIFGSVLSTLNASFPNGNFVVKEICKQGQHYFKCLYKDSVGWHETVVYFSIKTFKKKKQ